MNSVVLWILAIIYVEAVTEILISSSIFERVRHKTYEIGGFLSSLFSCGYCMSVWVAMTAAWALPTGLDNPIVGFVLATFVVHRLSNGFHELMVRWLNRIPWTVQLNQIQHVVVPGVEKYE